MPFYNYQGQGVLAKMNNLPNHHGLGPNAAALA